MWNWFKKETTGCWLAALILTATLVSLYWGFMILFIRIVFELIFVRPEQIPIEEADLIFALMLDVIFLILNPISCFVEETLRLLPLAIVVRVSKHKGWVVLTVLVTAFIFGLAHLDANRGLLLVLSCQAVLGLVFNLVYLKAGGLEGKWQKGFFAAWCVHTLYNWILTGSITTVMVLMFILEA